MTYSVFARGLDHRRRTIVVATTTAAITLAAALANNPIAYLCVALPVIVPFYLWLRGGALGMPILPVISGLYFVYYGVPMLRQQTIAYGPDQLIEAGATVGAFLLAASVGYWVLLRKPRRRNQAPYSISHAHIVRLVAIGLAAGIVFHFFIISGSAGALESYIGVIRSIVYTLTSVACYFLGCARALGSLKGVRWAFALAAMFLLIVLSLSNLFLVGGIMNLLAVFLGYAITAKRIPWLAFALACAVIIVFHAGKSEIRRAYWLPQSQSLQESSISQVPSLMTDWLTAGVDALSSGRAETDVLERASLLHILQRVQRATPDFIPYLEGETYALLPSMLLPRFVDPDKPQSQAGLNLLSVRYGLQSIESTASTTIGWGLIAEAYANFGYVAVIAVGVLLGALCGLLTRISVAAKPLSLPMLIVIAAALALFNVEMDASYLLITLVQTLASALVFAALPKLWAPRRAGFRSNAAAVQMSRMPAGEPARQR
jgi:hypothetical protein